MSKTYCPLPWIGMNVIPALTQPCCQWTHTGAVRRVDDVNKANQSDLFETTRQKMLNGEKVEGCQQCYLAEEAGAVSRRQEVIKEYGRITDVNLKLLDISFDNLCNLKCRGCCSTSSHLWFDDEREIFGETFFDEKYISQEFKIDLRSLEYINVSGGEPFLSKKYEKFSKELNDSNVIDNVHLCISTNGTKLPPAQVLESMIRAKKLSLTISIDGIGELNEYFRSNSKFDECLQTIHFMKSLKKSRKEKSTGLYINTTVNIYNVNLLKEIEDFFRDHREYELMHRVLYWPEQLSIRNLPTDYKNKIRPIVESYGPKYIDVLNELNSDNENLIDHFINFSNKLDNLRNESLKNANPLLYEYIKDKIPSTDSKVFFLKQLNILKFG